VDAPVALLDVIGRDLDARADRRCVLARVLGSLEDLIHQIDGRLGLWRVTVENEVAVHAPVVVDDDAVHRDLADVVERVRAVHRRPVEEVDRRRVRLDGAVQLPQSLRALCTIQRPPVRDALANGVHVDPVVCRGADALWRVIDGHLGAGVSPDPRREEHHALVSHGAAGFVDALDIARVSELREDAVVAVGIGEPAVVAALLVGEGAVALNLALDCSAVRLGVVLVVVLAHAGAEVGISSEGHTPAVTGPRDKRRGRYEFWSVATSSSMVPEVSESARISAMSVS